MAVDPKHAGLGAAGGPTHHDPFDDPTEDIPGAPPAAAVTGVPRAEEPRDGEGGGGIDPFEPGRVLCGRYELERVVGRGGFCVVFGARDRRREAAGDDDARVAIKVLRPELRGDEEARRRLTAEFRQLQRLSHPDIVRVFDLDRHGGDWFVVMELLEGVPLAGLIKHCEGGRVPARRALAIVQACAGALGWAHARGIVHGDVKPGNVFVTREEGIRLLDFGTASPQPGDGGRAPAFATPAYASPQVLEGGPATVADDIFSLGCMAFELLSGVHPFDRVDAREARGRGLRPDATAALPAPARAALEAALSFDPACRPRDMQAFVDLLGPGDADGIRAFPVPIAAGTTQPRAGLRRSLLVAAGVALAALVAAWLWPDADPPSVPSVSSVGSSPALPAVEAPSAGVPGQAGPDTVGQEVAPGAGTTGDGGPSPAEAALVPRTSAARRATQRVGFEREALLVSRSAPAAAVPVRRVDGSTGRATVAWRIEEGSARPGRDFAPPLSGTLVLADGQERATVFVPLLEAGRDADDRGFSVLIEEVGGAARKGEVDRVDVTLRSFVRDAPRDLAARD